MKSDSAIAIEFLINLRTANIHRKRHPIQVMSMLGSDVPDWVHAAAVLHDVVEDNAVSYSDLYELFQESSRSESIIKVVQFLTNKNEADKYQHIESIFELWTHRTDLELDSAIAIKYFDRGCNIQDFRNNGRDTKATEYKELFTNISEKYSRFKRNEYFSEGTRQLIDRARKFCLSV